MPERTVLVVDDEAAVREMIGVALEMAGYRVHEAADAKEAHAAVIDLRPDLILLDWMLPGMSGLDFARKLKRDSLTREIPVILLTARAHEDSKVQGLEVGADDYITKPFSPRELVARLKAVLRRTIGEQDEPPIKIGELELDPVAQRVSRGGEPIHLGPAEYRLLQFFMTHQDRVYSRGQLLDHVWGGNVYIEERTVDVHIRRLRKALDSPHDQLVQTVRGSGYRFSAQIA